MRVIREGTVLPISGLMFLMSAYILRRVLMLFPTLLGVSIIVFLMLHITPGDPAALHF